MLAIMLTALAALTPLRGVVDAHDPSSIVSQDGRWHVFVTSKRIQHRVSDDLGVFRNARPVFEAPPDWTSDVPKFDGTFWAPDIAYFGGRWNLYYSVSSWGSQNSAIALATTPTLDEADPRFGWVDRGIVIASREGDSYNTIDPAVFVDEDRVWLVFGSYWDGIRLIELDPASGLRLDDREPIKLASRQGGAIEAPAIAKQDGWYYLFVNFDRCCAGIESTYNIRVGRSRAIQGPYLDRDERDMNDGGGSLFMETHDRHIGPGHFARLQHEGLDAFSFHFYDRDDKGKPKLAIAKLEWRDGWPVVGH
jgi:arabinan endo-1,5-alpha-L-arabinosidase